MDPEPPKLAVISKSSRTSKARIRLNAATAYLREVEEDLLLGLMPATDGGFAYRRALSEESAAIRKYAELLRYLSHLATRPSENPLPPEAPIPHPPGEAHFRCPCGERLVVAPQFSAYKSLVNVTRDAAQLTGNCPTCGLSHLVVELPQA